MITRVISNRSKFKCYYFQDIKDLIEPPITGDVLEFLSRHIDHDMMLICKILNKNEDDAKLAIHILMKKILMTTNRNSMLQLIFNYTCILSTNLSSFTSN